MERKHFGAVRVLYSSSAHGTTDPQHKNHASLKLHTVTKWDEIL